jgi:hypothetical protein
MKNRESGSNFMFCPRTLSFVCLIILTMYFDLLIYPRAVSNTGWAIKSTTIRILNISTLVRPIELNSFFLVIEAHTKFYLY